MSSDLPQYPAPLPGTLTCDITIQVRNGQYGVPLIRSVGRPAELAEVKSVLQGSIEHMEQTFFTQARKAGLLYPGMQQVVPAAQAMTQGQAMASVPADPPKDEAPSVEAPEAPPEAAPEAAPSHSQELVD